MTKTKKRSVLYYFVQYFLAALVANLLNTYVFRWRLDASGLIAMLVTTLIVFALAELLVQVLRHHRKVKKNEHQ